MRLHACSTGCSRLCWKARFLLTWAMLMKPRTLTQDGLLCCAEPCCVVLQEETGKTGIKTRAVKKMTLTMQQLSLEVACHARH